jgi:ATP-binding cassette, subfamily B, bacterial MsbA
VLGSLGIAGASLKPLTGILNDIQQSAGAAARLREVLALESEPGHGNRLPVLARHQKSIEFENVSLTYPGGGAPALTSISLKIAHGQTVAFVGPNGSGKTTLLALVPRLFDPDDAPATAAPELQLPALTSDATGPICAGGRVLIDGHDIREYSVRSLRRQIAVVTQETVLFKGTIRSNIAYGAGNVDDARITDAARRARAEEFIKEKPGGYDSLIGENGSGLSGGQRQRLAIARAILRDPAILILDEATSMIDADSESKIAEAIADFVSGRKNAEGGRASSRTCLIVAHRLSTVVNADRIVVMDAGRIVDQGTHRELLGRCPVYRLIARTQLGLGGDAA